MEEFSNRISHIGLENLILSDGAAHKQFTSLNGIKDEENSFKIALELLKKV
jgi:hypothetical protein